MKVAAAAVAATAGMLLLLLMGCLDAAAAGMRKIDDAGDTAADTEHLYYIW